MTLSIKKLLAYLVFAIALLPVSIGATNEIPETIDYQESKLVLNGQGTRIIFFMKVYEGSLYLETKSSNAEKIVNENASEMVTADAMKKALSEGLQKSTNNNTGPILNEIEKLSSSFNSDVTSGDFYEFIYIPEIGTHVLKNDDLVEIIPGFEFKRAFFGIFLSKNPIQKNLKKAMLGG